MAEVALSPNRKATIKEAVKAFLDEPPGICRRSQLESNHR
jgi:hypothetical protein